MPYFAEIPVDCWQTNKKVIDMNKTQFLFTLGAVLCSCGFDYNSGFLWFVGICFILATLTTIEDK